MRLWWAPMARPRTAPWAMLAFWSTSSHILVVPKKNYVAKIQLLLRSVRFLKLKNTQKICKTISVKIKLWKTPKSM
jgi:hypothetical protein